MAVAPVNNGTSLRESGLSLRDVVVTLYRRKWVVVAVALPIIIAGGLALFNQTSSYLAAARVLVELANVDQPRWNVSGRNIDYDRELSTFFNIAMSVPVAEIAAASLEDSIPVIRDMDPNYADLQNAGDLKNFLMGHTNVTVVGESRILEFQVNAPYPRLALMCVGAMRDAFVDYQIHGGKNSQALVYYEEQIAVVRSQVDSLLAERAAILERAGYSELREELRLEAGSLIKAEYELVLARGARRAVEIEYQGLLAALQDDPRQFPMGKSESLSATLVYWRRLVGEHEDKLNGLLSVHTQNSIPVMQQKELLDTALANLRREEAAYVESVWINLEGLRSKESMMADLVGDFEVRRRNAPKAYYKVSMIDAETTSMRDLMEMLQGKLGEVRVALQADERVSSIVSLTQPELAQSFSGGKSLMYFAMLVFFALALGIIVAFLLEIVDHKISSPRDIEEYLKLPVFASIPKAE